MKLSILIPTTPERADDVSALFFEIRKQAYDIYGFREWEETVNVAYGPDYTLTMRRYVHPHKDLEVVTLSDEKKITIGEKRDMLYKLAQGDYSWQVDSDDMIDREAIKLIFAAIVSNPDCVTFEEKCMMRGERKRSNHSLKYDKWQDGFDGYDYVRTPYYKDVIKTDIARSVAFPHVSWNEDEIWSKALKPHLNTEVHIPKELYYYIYNPTETPEERYGLNK